MANREHTVYYDYDMDSVIGTGGFSGTLGHCVANHTNSKGYPSSNAVALMCFIYSYSMRCLHSSVVALAVRFLNPE